MNEPFAGMYVATLTPFDFAGEVDLGVIRAHTQFLAEAGVAGVCPVGTTGEFLYLSQEEKKFVVRETAVASAGRLKVMAGVSAFYERDIVQLVEHAFPAEADAVFLPPPSYYPIDQPAVHRFYSTVANHTKLPVFAYNIPAYAGNEVAVETAKLLVYEGRIAGIKDSTGKADRMQALMDAIGDRARVFAASDGFVSEARKIGAHGFISAIANVFPKALVRIWNGDESLQPPVNAIRAAIKQCGGIPALKYLLYRRGFGTGVSRMWFVTMSYGVQTALDRVFDEAVAAGLE